MKKILAALLAAVMVAVMIPTVGIVPVSAATRYESEGNNDFETANTIYFGDTVKGKITSDADYFTFDVKASGYIVLSFTNPISTDGGKKWSLTVYKYSNSLDTVHSQTVYMTIASTKTPKIGVEPGKYYVKIEDASNYQKSVRDIEYGIKVDFTSTGYWESELNNSFETADTIKFNQKYGAYLGGDGGDYFRFDVKSSGYIVLNFTNPVSTDGGKKWSLNIYKYSDSVDTVHSQTVYATIASTKTPKIGVEPGKYYVKIEDASNYQNSVRDIEYGIKVDFTSTGYWESELNNSFETADTIKFNQKYGAYLGGGDVDYYGFEMKSSGYIKLNFTNTVSTDGGKKWSVKVYKYANTIDEMHSQTVKAVNSSTMSGKIYLGTGKYYVKIEDVSNYQNSVRDIEYGLRLLLNPSDAKGWVKEGGYWVFYENGYKVKNQWKKDSRGWCYLDSNGRMKTNAWVKDSAGWCYVGSDGYCVTNAWRKDSKGWCYLDGNGRMAVNKWVMDSVGWCYVGADGYCVTSTWKKDSHGWCYLDANGRMATNKWVMDSVGWCYVGADGYAVTNTWKRDSHGWCYLGKNGSMLKYTWLTSGGKRYFIDKNGYMVTGTVTISGKTYTFDANGVLVS